jgi:hypothetical protein
MNKQDEEEELGKAYILIYGFAIFVVIGSILANTITP